jgi:hypothetical protein
VTLEQVETVQIALVDRQTARIARTGQEFAGAEFEELGAQSLERFLHDPADLLPDLRDRAVRQPPLAQQ